MSPTPYIACFECGHVYATTQDLVDAYNRVVSEMNANPRSGGDHIPLRTVGEVDRITFCQECIHDF